MILCYIVYLRYVYTLKLSLYVFYQFDYVRSSFHDQGILLDSLFGTSCTRGQLKALEGVILLSQKFFCEAKKVDGKVACFLFLLVFDNLFILGQF